MVGGGLNSAGGVGRPDAVTGASVIIQSRRNLYRSDSPVPTAIGWTLFGGADAPSPIFVSQASTFNSLQIHSIDDTIDGFRDRHLCSRGTAVQRAFRAHFLESASS